MIINKKVKVIEEHEQFVARVCDLCGRRTSQYNDWEIDVDNNTERVEISKELGSNYPEGGSGTKVSCDLCPVCFDTVLRPFLESKGVVFKEEDVWW